jgi:hypothetical protein
MCRNIKVLFNFEPPTTPDEMRAAALQFVRKVSGMNKPSQENEEAFQRAIDEVTASVERLLSSLTARGTVRTREGERERAKLRFSRREAQRLIDR